MAGSKIVGAFTDDSLLGEGDRADGSVSKLRSGPGLKAAPSGRVLVVDDEIAVGRTIQRLLGERHEVVVLTNGVEAIDLIAGGAEFDVILCDVSMPEVTGLDVYARVVASRPELGERFVFMTGGTFNTRAREFFATVSVERIDKPFDLDVLRAVVRDWVAQAR